MDNMWLDIIEQSIEEGADKLFMVTWMTECGPEFRVFTDTGELLEYLSHHNLDPEKTEVLEACITKRMSWTKTVELKEKV